MIIQISPKEIPFIKNSDKLCCNPYPNHKNGCPNYGKKKGCPPNLAPLNEIINLNGKVYLIYTDFNISEHADRIKRMHPDWSEKQIYCCLYWQPKARKLHREELEKYKKEKRINMILASPEAYGVNVNLLMKKAGIKLEWPPRKITRIVSLGGWQNKK